MIKEIIAERIGNLLNEDKLNPILQNNLLKATTGLENTKIGNLTEIAHGYSLINRRK